MPDVAARPPLAPAGPRRVEPRLAVALGGLVAVLAGFAAGLHAATPAGDRLPLLATPELSAFTAAAVSGAALVRATARSRVGWLLLVCGAAGTAYTASRALLVAGDVPGPVVTVAASVAAWSWSLALLPLLLVLPLLLPDGGLPPERWRPLLGMGVASTTVVVLTTAVRSGEPGGLGVPNPLGVPALDPALAVVGRVTDLLDAVLMVFVLAAVVARSRGLPVERRRWLRPPAAALLAAVACTALDLPLLAHAAAALLPVSLAVAVRRPATAPDVRALVPGPRRPS